MMVISGGGDALRLEAALRETISKGVSAILSFGIGGGLAPGLRSGTALVARSIIEENGKTFECDRSWSQRLAKALGTPVVDMAGVDRPVAEPAAKRALHVATRAAVVDTESHIAARVAAEHGLPFTAFRVIADPAERRLPPAALVGLGENGRVALGSVMRELAKQPRQIPHLVRTTIDTNAAFVSLFRGRQMVVGGGFGFFDLGELLLDVPLEDVIGGSLPV